MLKSALAIAAVTALSITTPAAASITTTNYTLSGAGSGTMSIDFDDVALTTSLSALNFTLTGGSTTFDLLNAGYASGLLGGNVSGVDVVSSFAGEDDFFTFLSLSSPLGAHFTSYFIAGNQGISEGTLTVALAPPNTPGVPEPTTWAMMLLGFGAIGLTIRRRRKSCHVIA